MANAPPRITAADVANTGSAFRKPFPGIVDCSWQLLQQKHTKLQTGISWLLETWKLEPTQEEKRRRLCWRTKWLELHLDTYHLIKLLKYTTNKIHKYKVPGMGLHMIFDRSLVFYLLLLFLIPIRLLAFAANHFASISCFPFVDYLSTLFFVFPSLIIPTYNTLNSQDRIPQKS